MLNSHKMANIVAVVHLVWIIIGALSLPLTLLYEPYKYVTVAFAVITVLSWILWKDCVLLILENKFRGKDNPAEVYREAFISHYLQRFFHIRISTFFVRTLIYSYMVILLVVTLTKFNLI